MELSRDAMDRLWSHSPLRPFGELFEGAVADGVANLRALFEKHSASGPVYAAALYVEGWDRQNVDEEAVMLGIASDREELVAEGDLLSVWNATLFNDSTDDIAVPTTDQELRKQAAAAGIAGYDFWLLTEVARAANDQGVRPAEATDDFVVFYAGSGLDPDFEVALAYTTPAATYESFVARGLAAAELDDETARYVTPKRAGLPGL